MKIAVCVIATNKYKDFIPQLSRSICKNFLLDHQIEIHLFTDGDFQCVEDDRVKCIPHSIESYGWPYATLYRYKIMTSVEYTTDYIFYLDVDMNINDVIGDEILGELVAVRHPGYYWTGWGSENVDPRSQAFIDRPLRKKYFCGGVQGGSVKEYYKAMLVLDSMIQEDERNGVMAEFHDESHWNKYLIGKEVTEMDCSYCMPQSIAKRNYHKIQKFPARILALEKNFEEYRSVNI